MDGNKNGVYNRGSCIHTKSDNAWWEVDLQAIYIITEVSITNRGDCCGELVCLYVLDRVMTCFDTCIYTHACMHACMNACMYVCIRACMHVCMHGICIYMRILTWLSTHARAHIRTCTHTHTRIHKHAHTCTYTHAHKD